ncbi:MAG: hypothetical protein JW863_13335 [Chitinispirillaceae bacterium]|nr:hypothetical protein [Chitinispirillaceae bacterium]
MILAAEPAGGIIQYLSPECGIQFEVLTELADALHTESKALREACPEGGKMTERCRYIASSAERLHELFLRPISYLQEVIRINRLGDAPSA